MKLKPELSLNTIFFCSLLVCFTYTANASGALENATSRPNLDTGPTKVAVGIWIVDIDSIDSVSQSFNANVFVVLQWNDPRLAHGEKASQKYELDDIWNPRIQIANESGIIRRTLPEIADVIEDGTVTYRQRYVGPFSQPLKLMDFPFDRNVFSIQLVALGCRPEDIQFEPYPGYTSMGLKHGAGIADNISLPDWTIENYETKSSPYETAPRLQTAGYIFEFIARRDSEHYVWKVILPLILIVCMSWTVFWIDPTNLGTQIGVATTSMLTLIAYRFAIDQHVPKVSYMTRLDQFVLASTILVFLSLIQANVTGYLVVKKKNALAVTIDRWCRLIYPLGFLATILLTLVW